MPLNTGAPAVTLAASMTLGVAANGAPLIDLYDWGFNLDGVPYLSPATYSTPAPLDLPSAIDTHAFDFSNGPGSGGGLGTITVTLATPGAHTVIAMFDPEIDAPFNSAVNETGQVHGMLQPGQSWEIDEPGYTVGDLVSHLIAGTLDNSLPLFQPDDLALAQGWAFPLAPDETATVTFTLSLTAPTTGFYLTQHDPDSQVTLYFQSALTLGRPNAIPEPTTVSVMSAGLVLLAGWRRWHQVS